MIDILCDELDRLCDAPWRQLDAIDVLLAQIDAEIRKTKGSDDDVQCPDC